MSDGKLPLGERLSDYLNPLLVREVRQSLRSRIFVYGVVLTTLFSLVLIISGILSNSTGTARDLNEGGRTTFQIIYFFMWSLLCVLLPVVSANRFHLERNTGEFELFTITGIPPRSIILGKLQASLVQAFLFLSVAAPFMMVCYILRGISALDIMISITMTFFFALVLTQGGILVGAFATSKPFFVLLGFPYICFLLYTYVFPMMLIQKNMISQIAPSGTGYFVTLLIILFYISYAFVLAFMCSTAALELQNRNRSLHLKIFLLSAAVLLPAVIFLAAHEIEYRMAAFYCLFGAPAVIAALLIPQGIGKSPAPTRKIWERKHLKPFKPIFHVGAGSSFIWYAILMLVLSAWEIFLGHDASISLSRPSMISLSAICASVLFWSIAGNGILRHWFPKAPVILLSIVGCGTASVASIFFFVSKNEEIGQLLFPPTIPVLIYGNHLDSIAVGACAVFWPIMLIVGIRGYFRQIEMEKSESPAAQ